METSEKYDNSTAGEQHFYCHVDSRDYSPDWTKATRDYRQDVLVPSNTLIEVDSFELGQAKVFNLSASDLGRSIQFGSYVSERYLGKWEVAGWQTSLTASSSNRNTSLQLRPPL